MISEDLSRVLSSSTLESLGTTTRTKYENEDLSPGKTKKYCCGNIVFPINVSLLAHHRKKLLRKQNLLLRNQKCFPTNSECRNKICFPCRKLKCFPTNSETFLLQKQCFLVYPHVFECFQHEKHCFPPNWTRLNNVLRLYCKHKQYFKIRVS